MKLSELKACETCGGKLLPFFYVLKVEVGVFNIARCNRIVNDSKELGSLPLAEAVAPDADKAISVVPTETTVMICRRCGADKLRLTLQPMVQS